MIFKLIHVTLFIKQKKYEKILSILLVLLLIAGCSSAPVEATGTVYEVTQAEHNGDIKMKVTIDGDKITNVEVVEHEETDGLSDEAINDLPKLIVENNSINVDTY